MRRESSTTHRCSTITKSSTVIKQTHSSHSEISHNSLATTQSISQEENHLPRITLPALPLEGHVVRGKGTQVCKENIGTEKQFKLEQHPYLFKHTLRSVVAASWESRKMWVVGLPSPTQKETNLLGKFYRTVTRGLWSGQLVFLFTLGGGMLRAAGMQRS